MRHNLSRIGLLAVMLLSACQPTTTQLRPLPTVKPELAEALTDPCADQLGALCEKLFLYYVAHQKLPSSLAQLPATTNRAATPLACPVCHEAYVYDLQGLEVTGRQGKLIVYDAVACHREMRNGIFFEASQAGEPIVIRVVRLADKAIVWPQSKGSQ